MHDIEPHYTWRDYYRSEQDERCPFFGRVYDEFTFSQRIYNYFIHPQWDAFGSQTLYMKILYTDYDKGVAIFEMLGEWNDCLQNDIMFLKREVVDELLRQGIDKYILICENVLNFHGDDDDYYAEWHEDVAERGGWICFLNLLDHVRQEMEDTRLQAYVHFGPHFQHLSWRTQTPRALVKTVEGLLQSQVRQLPG